MDQEQQSRWRPTRRQLLWTGGIILALAFLSIVICGYFFGWKWTGLVKVAHYHKRTLWDWMKLLIVPVVIAAGGIWFNLKQRQSEQYIADQRALDEALQAYLDQMSQLLTDKDRPLRQSNGDDQAKEDEEDDEDGEVRTLARARTLTVLATLDGRRKWRVLMFLQEAGLISIKDGPVVPLKWANLQDADLGEVVLEDADLSETKLQRAYLYAAKLRGARLAKADLSSAILTAAEGVTDEQLAQAACLEGATMPDGQKLRGDYNPDGPTFEEWLKDKEGSKEDEKNG